METETIFDFSGVEAPKSLSGDILSPGQYVVKTIEIELKKPENKTPYLVLTFYNNEGKKVSANFFISVKALPRLQYLNEQITGKLINRKFGTVDEIAAWFELIVKGYNQGKTNKVGVIVGREITDTKVYSRVIDWDFLPVVTPDFTEEVYSEDTILGDTRLQKVNTYKPAQPSSSETILNLPSVDEVSDLPF